MSTSKAEPEIFRVSLPFQATWHFVGWDKDDTGLVLSLCLVARRGKLSKGESDGYGLCVDYRHSHFDIGLSLVKLTPQDAITNKVTIWLPEGNGIYVNVDQTDRFHLLTIHQPFIPPYVVFLSFTTTPYELSGNYKQSTFIRQKNAQW